MAQQSGHEPVYAIVLAAGSASRFGSLKQLEPWRGEPLVRHASQTAAEVCGSRSLLVTGPEWNRVRLACEPFAGAFVVNDRYREGLGSSLALAVRCLGHTAAAVIVLLADQPLVDAVHVTRLLEEWRAGDADIVATAYADTAGVPAVFGACTFDRLAGLTGDKGARELLAGAGFEVRTIRCDQARVDIDTVEDLARLSSNVRS